MTNSYDIAHGLSQDAPGPLAPVEIAQQDDTLARTGNTARDQEMYVAGIRTGEENTKHNAAIRASVPVGWKLVPIEPTIDMIVDGQDTGSVLGPRARRIYAAMLNAAPTAPGVSTVEDAQAVAWMEPGIDVPVTNEYRNKTPLRQAKYCVPLYKHAPVNAPAAGDALDAARYRALVWVCEQGADMLDAVCASAGVDEEISPERLIAIADAAIEAQRKGGQ